ncbi:sugar transporter [Coprinopsis sp. MPI-PUGE-AT-0042]|nr:sugar transporter [Coprinopsis sp. MPI-PUGE-AT-0042]
MAEESVENHEPVCYPASHLHCLWRFVTCFLPFRLSLNIAYLGFLFGYDIGVISGCLIMPDFIRRFGELDAAGEYHLSPSRQSIITSSSLSRASHIFTFVGALGQSLYSRQISVARRPFWLGPASSLSVCAIQTATEYSLAQITIGRFIAGLGVGALSAIVPLYTGETAPKALRGTLLVLYQLQIIIGLFLSYVLDLATHTIPNSASWRVPVGLQMLWGLIMLSGISSSLNLLVTLLGTGRRTEARRVVALLNGASESNPVVDELLGELEYAIKAENEGGKATWAEMFLPPKRFVEEDGQWNDAPVHPTAERTKLLLLLWRHFLQECRYQAVTLCHPDHLGSRFCRWYHPCTDSSKLGGRRKLLMTGALMQAGCAIMAGLVGHFTLAPTNTPIENLTKSNIAGGDTLIAFAVLHVFGFSMFWGPTPWVYLGESFPLRIRPKSIALGSATNWFWNFLLSFFAPRIAAKIGPLILLIFFGMLLVGFGYVYLAIPETKGLTLEEVDEMYRSGVKPWHSSTWKPHLSEEAHEKGHRPQSTKPC